MNNNKPLLLELEDFKSELYAVINKAISNNIPSYLLGMIISGAHNTISARAKAEIDMLRAEESKNDRPVTDNEREEETIADI